MADSKVTDLALATTPLTGAEVVYLVQSGFYVQATAQEEEMILIMAGVV